MTSVSYVPGDRTAVTGESIWMLVDAVPGSASVHEIWRRVQLGPGLDALMTGLLQAGFDRLPDFALLAVSGQGMRLICRGLGAATMVSEAGTRRVDGAGLVTWNEHVVPADITSVVLGGEPAVGDLTLPALAGVFLATSVVIDLVVAKAPKSPEECVPPPAGISDERAPVVVPAAPAPEPDEPELAEDREYDDVLFGATQARSIEGAAIRPAGEPDPGPPLAFAAPSVARPADLVPDPEPAVTFERPAGPLRADAAAASPNPLPKAVPGGLIMSVPWDLGDRDSGTAPPTPAQAPASGWDAGASISDGNDPDEGLTVRRGAPAAPQARPVLADHIGPVVLAVLCRSQHLNPPNAAACRSCGEPVPEQEPVSATRPVVGVLRLSTGDVISLDRGVVMGRNPPPAEFDGDERLHTVKLAGGDGEISRAHLKVTIDGWHVLVTDLRSTNGTLITLPGREPELASPGYPTQILPGTVVTLADGIDFRFEVS